MQKEDGSQAFWLKYLWGSLESADLVPPPVGQGGHSELCVQILSECLSSWYNDSCPGRYHRGLSAGRWGPHRRQSKGAELVFNLLG